MHKDLTNLTFGKLTALKIVGKHPKYRDKIWLCKCSCGNETTVRSVSLSSGSIKSCGCTKLSKNIINQRFGKLLALEKDNNYKRNYWKVKCDCGSEKSVALQSLLSGVTTSCGCFRKEVSQKRCKENHPLWKGGGDLKSLKQRTSSLYKNWRKAVISLHNNTCIKCGNNQNLVAHHIFSFHTNQEQRLRLSNGCCFCVSCHKNFHRKFGKTNNTYTQLVKFIHGNLFSPV